VVSLIAKTPLDGLLPAEAGPLTLREVTYDPIQSIAVFKGKSEPVRKAMKQATGAELPLPNRTISPVLWFAPDQYLVLGHWVQNLDGIAAVTDQSDAWAILSVEGAEVENILSRLIPIDLRYAVFSEGQTARTMIGHMTASVTRMAADRFELMVMRSMAGTLVHEVCKAAKVYDSRR